MTGDRTEAFEGFVREAGSPLYAQIEDRFRDAITRGTLAPGSSLPAERALAEALGVSRITVRKAFARLQQDGLLRRRRGAGTVVASPGDRIDKSFTRITSFSEDMLARGKQPGNVWLSREQGLVSPEEALSLGLSPGSAIYRLVRIRLADGEPIAIETSVVPTRCLASLDDIAGSLYAALEKRGCRPVKALQRLRAVCLDTEKSALLGMIAGAPALLIERRGFDRGGVPIEVTTSYYRGDSYDFLAESND